MFNYVIGQIQALHYAHKNISAGRNERNDATSPKMFKLEQRSQGVE